MHLHSSIRKATGSLLLKKLQIIPGLLKIIMTFANHQKYKYLNHHNTNLNKQL